MRFSVWHLLSGIIVLIASPLLSQRIITVKSGATIDMRLVTAIDASKMKAGDVVHLETIWPLTLGQWKIPAQTEALGRVVSVHIPSNKKGSAELCLVVEKIVAKDFVVALHGYPVRLQHRIVGSQSITGSTRIPESGSTVSSAGPPPGSGEGNVVIRARAPSQMTEEPSLPFGGPGVVPLLEPMPDIKRVKDPPSTILKNRGNVIVSVGTTVVVREFSHQKSAH